MSISFAFKHTSLTADSGIISHRFSCAICLFLHQFLLENEGGGNRLTCPGRTTYQNRLTGGLIVSYRNLAFQIG
jgi:hypothetical protein